MFLRKGQSTAEYAIVIGLVVAVAAGILGVTLKGGMRQKQKQALNYLLDAGSTVTEFSNVGDQDELLFSQEARQTTVKGGTDFADTTVMKKGGAEKKYQKQTTESVSTSIETIDEAN
jgi:hypothetical protein